MLGFGKKIRADRKANGFLWGYCGLVIVMQLLGELSLVIASVSVVIGVVLFYLEYRRQREDKGYEAYVRTMMALSNLKQQMIVHPELQELYEGDKEYKALSSNERKMFHWSGMLLDIGEVVFIASPLGRGWMGDEEWEGWGRFLGSFMATSEIFRLVWAKSRDSYAKPYRQFIDGLHEEISTLRE